MGHMSTVSSQLGVWEALHNDEAILGVTAAYLLSHQTLMPTHAFSPRPAHAYTQKPTAHLGQPTP